MPDNDTSTRHPTEYPTQLPFQLSELRYDVLANFLGDLAEKLTQDASRDGAKGYVCLEHRLSKAAQAVREAKTQIDAAWMICAPHMAIPETVKLPSTTANTVLKPLDDGPPVLTSPQGTFSIGPESEPSARPACPASPKGCDMASHASK